MEENEDPLPTYEEHIEAYNLYERILELFSGYDYKITKLAIAKVKWQMFQLEEAHEDIEVAKWE